MSSVKLTDHRSLEQLVGLNLVQRRVEEVILAHLHLIRIINRSTKLRSLRIVSIDLFATRPGETYLFVQELEISGALILSFSDCLDLLSCLCVLASPIGVVIIPLILCAIVVGAIKLEIVTQCFVTV